MRIGIGYDIHRLVEGRSLVLGGVHVPSSVGPLAHSDGDVICHAIADALLGSLALGDLGTHFPPSDPAWKDADSVSLLRRVVGLVLARDHVVVNVDVMVVLESPKLAPHIPAMTRVLCEALAAPVDAVSVKATTNEGLGSLGRGEGVAAWAVTTVDRCRG